MIRHILLFKFRENTSIEAIDRIMDKFSDCEEKLTTLTSIEYGENVSSKEHLSKGFTHGVIMNFKTQDDIIAYGHLREHKEAQQLQQPHVLDVLVFDIEF